VGDGVNRKEAIKIINPVLYGNNLADYGIRDSGSRIGVVSDGYFQEHLEWSVIQEPSTVDFSEFFRLIRCQGNDAKGFLKHLPTSVGRATDTLIHDCIMFRPTEWFSYIDAGQRFTYTKCMVGSQVATFLGGINITASDILTANAVTAEHVIDGLYVESNTTYADAVITGTHDGAGNAAVLTDSGAAWAVDGFVGRTLINVTDGSSAVITSNTATTVTGTLVGGTDNDWDASDSYEILGMVAVQVGSESTGKTVGGCVLSNIITEPANRVSVANLRTPQTAGTVRSVNIKNVDAKGGFANVITIGAGVAFTRVGVEKGEGITDTYIKDRGTKSVINNQSEVAAGKAGVPSTGGVGELIVNTSNDSFWTKNKEGAFLQIGHGSIVHSETYDLPNIAAGANTIIDIPVAGVTLGDYSQVAFEQNMLGLMVSSYCRTGLVTLSIYNPTVGAIDIASTTLRILVTKH
jgi:hypothetical protein